MLVLLFASNITPFLGKTLPNHADVFRNCDLQAQLVRNIVQRLEFQSNTIIYDCQCNKWYNAIVEKPVMLL